MSQSVIDRESDETCLIVGFQGREFQFQYPSTLQPHYNTIVNYQSSIIILLQTRYELRNCPV